MFDIINTSSPQQKITSINTANRPPPPKKNVDYTQSLWKRSASRELLSLC